MSDAERLIAVEQRATDLTVRLAREVEYHANAHDRYERAQVELDRERSRSANLARLLMEARPHIEGNARRAMRGGETALPDVRDLLDKIDRAIAAAPKAPCGECKGTGIWECACCGAMPCIVCNTALRTTWDASKLLRMARADVEAWIIAQRGI